MVKDLIWMNIHIQYMPNHTIIPEISYNIIFHTYSN